MKKPKKKATATRQRKTKAGSPLGEALGSRYFMVLWVNGQYGNVEPTSWNPECPGVIQIGMAIGDNLALFTSKGEAREAILKSAKHERESGDGCDFSTEGRKELIIVQCIANIDSPTSVR